MLFLKSFFYGVLSGIGALIIELIAFSAISTYQYPSAYLLTKTAQSALLGSLLFLLVSAFIEEWVKFTVLKRISIKDIHSYLKRLPFLFLFGCGFASIELFILSQTTNMHVSASLITPILGIASFHILSIIFIGFGLLFTSKNHVWATPIIPIITTLLHFKYNVSIEQQTPVHIYTLIFLFILCTLFIAFRPAQQSPFLQS